MPQASIKFIHCADLHLDSSLRGLAHYEGAPVQAMRAATRRSFSNIVDLAIERAVDFVVIAGDVFDKDWPDFNTGLFFANELRRLAGMAVRVFIVSGNHDAVNKISKTVTLPKNVTWFESTAATSIIDDEQLGIAIHGQSFSTSTMTQDLACRYPDAHPDLLNIGMLHTSLTGREGQENYAPTTPDRLLSKGYQYWALGHIHKRMIMQKHPWIAFPGNIQGRHARELGPKGCLVVEGSAEQGVHSVDFVPTDVARWEHLVLDVTGFVHLDDLQAVVQQKVQQLVLAAGDRPLAVRLSVQGRTALHGILAKDPEKFRAEACAWLNEASGGTAWLEKIKGEVTAPMDRATLAKRDDPIGMLLRKFDQLALDQDAVARVLASALSDLEQKMPVELRDELRSHELGAEFLRSAQERLLSAMAVDSAP